MKRDDVWLGKCCYVFCDNEAHNTCDKCDDDFCDADMANSQFCKECNT